MKTLALLFILLFVLNSSFAQRHKFKELSKKDLELQACEFFPEAKAMYLEKVGNINFDLTEKGVFLYRHTIGVRIKIFDPDNTDKGDVRILFYSPGGGEEKINNIRACTYNLENGKVVKTELARSDIYRRRINTNIEEINFALPSVKAGSVIEYSFNNESRFITNLSAWHFQEDIPVRYSEINYTIPEYFVFQARMVGEIHSTERKEKDVSLSFLNNLLTCSGKHTKISVKNVVPVEEEPFVANQCDLPFRMTFQLIAINLPDMPPREIAGSYQKFHKSILERDEFWKSANRGNFPKEVTALEGENDKDKLEKLYKWVHNSVQWNGKNGIYCSKSVNERLKEGSGNAGEINLMLNALLIQNGFKAYPVLLSTRGNGMLHPVYPSQEDFNYVISAVNIGDELILCDATSGLMPGLLPVRCLNGDGWLVAETGEQMIPLKGTKADYKVISSKIEIKDGVIYDSISAWGKDYAFLNRHSEFHENGKEKIEERIKSSFPESVVTGYNLEMFPKKYEESFVLESPLPDESHIYIRPFKYGIPEESPFKRDTRKFVVDFPYGIRYNIMSVLKIPEGYEVELPENRHFYTTGRGAQYSFSVINNDTEILFSFNLILKKLMFVPEEYAELKTFFDQISDVKNIVAVLKKKV